MQRELYTAASQSLLFWVNAFCYTLRMFVIDADGTVRQCAPHEAHVPFVTWEVQDRHILAIESAIIKGTELLTDKSRDMGATWDHIAALHHQWLFRADRSFLEISRKEDCVDTYGKGGSLGSDPGTLLGKHDYINRWLPSWQVPIIDRKRMHMTNLNNHSRIDGESSNAAAGSSDRRTAILLDEMAKMDEGEAIKRSTKDVTACRLANSTPNGPGTAFSTWRQSGQIKVFQLMYWDHPEKGRGRYVKHNETNQKWEIRSPWFNQQEKERTPKELAIDVLADHIGSGDTFFEAHNVELHRRLFARQALSTHTIDFRKGISSDQIPKALARSQKDFVQCRATSKGPLRVWSHTVNGRLDQTRNYVLTADISKGQGASNSVIDVTCVETREKVCEWADANTPPYELARIACALALWVGGSRNNGRPLMAWEANGPGWDFGRQVVKIYQYPFYFVDHNVGAVTEKKGGRYGWHSSREKKETALGMLRRAYAHGGFINHSEEALTEALSYVYFGGGIGPAVLIEESEAARKTHGDRVIADMLALVVLDEAPRARAVPTSAPMNSLEARRRQWVADKKRQQKRHAQKSFDFRKGAMTYAN